MKALLVGADRLGNIPAVLLEHGISVLAHVPGRSTACQRAEQAVPAGAQLVILFTDFVGHNVMWAYRKAAKRQGLRIVTCRRSTCSLRVALAKGTTRPPAQAIGR